MSRPPSRQWAQDHVLTPAARSRTWILGVAGILYFSEGLPYGIVTELFPLYLRLEHVGLGEIGLINTVGLAWTLKLFWAPLVDVYGTYRSWIAWAVLAIAGSLGALAMLHGHFGPPFWVIIAILALASASQDLAVDAFTIRATPLQSMGPVNSTRVIAYRAALIFAGAGLTAVAARWNWRAAFGSAAVLAAIIFAFTLRLPDLRGSSLARIDLLRGLSRWLRRPNAAMLLAVVFLYRLGEFAVTSMIKPFWVDRGYSATEIATVTTALGVSLTIAGAIAGGALLERAGLYRGMLVLGVAQVASNLGYAIVSTAGGGRVAMYAAAVVENFAYGLGTAAFLAFLMSICDPERAATEFALLTAAYGLTRTAIGSASGFLTQRWGYPSWFWLSVALGIPALLLLPGIRSELGETARLEASAS
jgi:PAT family beta-lactamase induction signal transducer AmpG